MATNTFYLKVIAANRVFYSGRCRSIIVPEFDGQKEILAHHEDMVIAVDEGEMRQLGVRGSGNGLRRDSQQPCDTACRDSRASGGNRYSKGKRGKGES